MTARYAEGTSVDVGRSRQEIERILTRYGASALAYGWQDDRAAYEFVLYGRHIRFILPMPGREDFSRTPTGLVRSRDTALKAYEAEVRRRWRALALVIKAKLEAIESGVASLDDEFLAYTVLPSGETVAEHIGGQVAAAIAGGPMPQIMGALGPGGDR